MLILSIDQNLNIWILLINLSSSANVHAEFELSLLVICISYVMLMAVLNL